MCQASSGRGVLIPALPRLGAAGPPATTHRPPGLALLYAGFAAEAAAFYRALSLSPDRAWFEAHRSTYEERVLAPARSLVVALGEALHPLAPGLHADPRINRSLFRIQRDTRFQPDLPPYKDHLGIWLWEGAGHRMSCSGFYLELGATGWLLGVGLYRFPRELLAPYRQAVDDPRRGAALQRTVDALQHSDGYRLGGLHYKRVPRGFASEHPRARLLRHQGLTFTRKFALEELPDDETLPGTCAAHFEALLPVHRWLVSLTEGLAGVQGLPTR